MSFRRRCLLFVPGNSERKIRRAMTLGADGLIFDLEDAVAPGEKATARAVVAAVLGEMPRGCERIVRINSLGTGLTVDDIRATIAGRPDTYMLPKVSDATEVAAVASIIADSEAAQRLPRGQIQLLLIATETPAGVVNLPSLARAHPRVTGLLWGAEDLSAAVGARRTHGPEGRLLDIFAYARARSLLAAAAARIHAIDAPFLRIGDVDGLRREAEEAAWTGFSGKAAVHPEQVTPILEAFTPSSTELAEAHALVAAWNDSGQPGTFAHAGQMVDAPHLARARRILESA